MEFHKKIGAITIAIALLLALASLVFSENRCHPDAPIAQSLYGTVTVCLLINVYEELPGNALAPHVYIYVKYLLLASAVLVALGVLWYMGAIPTWRRKARAPSEPARVNDA